MKKNFKYDRLSEEIKVAVSTIINDEIDTINFVTIIDVEITKDLGDAKIYYQCLIDSEEEITQFKLEKMNKFIRKRLAEDVQMRKVPNLLFKYDHSLENYNKIDDILKKV
ncbi:MAG: 30S ribosome-binding factor RbfA [Spiroplasma sp.]|nr:30S ribosome-binding factor RbfA [Mycoplasmatales bacterium]